MKSSDFPALYQSADQLSLQYQGWFFLAIACDLALLIGAAVLTAVGTQSAEVAIGQALMLLGALACSIYLSAVRPDRYWYTARAVTESIKTITWRFVSRAEPFQSADDIDASQFRNVLRAIIDQNKATAERLVSHLEHSQITDAMMALRQAPLQERLDRYVTDRIVEQLNWYAKKAAFNRRMARRFFTSLVLANGLALLSALARIRFPAAPYWPTDIFVAAASALLAWIQAKRFSELSASYALAAHEISLIKEQSANVVGEKELSAFVGDAENAFSREHTQWVARKDT